jgi:hypothetical protein
MVCKVPDHIDGPKVLTNDKKGAMLAGTFIIPPMVAKRKYPTCFFD